MKLIIRHVGYETLEKTLNSPEDDLSGLSLKSSITMLQEVLVSSDERPVTAQRRIDAESIMESNPKNVGDIFGDKVGFGVQKRGGYAMDPVFRSFRYDQLNLIFDGGLYIANACPNRMDPASTQLSTAEINKIELVKGPYTMRYGATMGGLINLITDSPEVPEKFGVNGELEGGYEVNGNGITGRGAVYAAGRVADVSVQAGIISFDNYKNGDGKKVPSSFQTSNYTVKMGVNPSDNQRVQVSWRQAFGKDILHASLPMDSPKDNSTMASVDYSLRDISDKLISLNMKGYYTYVDHLMTNEWRPNYPQVATSSPVTSNTFGGRAELGIALGLKTTLYTGLDLRSVAKDGVRNRLVKMMNGKPLEPPKVFTDLIWQDSWMHTSGLFAESKTTINEHWTMNAGARVDIVNSGANNPAPDFEALYGTIDPETQVNLSLTASATHHFGKYGMFQLALGRGQRSPDLLERYINHFIVGMDSYEYVGDPNLESEINNQADLTISNRSGSFSWSINVFYAIMENYITAAVDTTLRRKYNPTVPPIYAKRYINIDKACQTGFEIEIGYRITRALSVQGGAFYTRAQNRQFDEPLAQITPFTGLLSASFTKEKYWMEFKGRLVADQERVAASFDEDTTPGFGVYDFMAGYRPFHSLDITLTFKNLFDNNYYEHLSWPYNNQPEQSQLYEPGRSMRIGAKFRF
ncbi:MAG: TonB-dependent receptor [Cyclobacteriaceae bacterium]|nr:TonB-dependent receptor [Cyclobacteriaceae bacterium]